jgi:hypothetical protein
VRNSWRSIASSRCSSSPRTLRSSKRKRRNRSVN